jgi:hypothetical protein
MSSAKGFRASLPSGQVPFFSGPFLSLTPRYMLRALGPARLRCRPVPYRRGWRDIDVVRDRASIPTQTSRHCRPSCHLPPAPTTHPLILVVILPSHPILVAGYVESSRPDPQPQHQTQNYNPDDGWMPILISPSSSASLHSTRRLIIYIRLRLTTTTIG